jgi:hypothetical protein
MGCYLLKEYTLQNVQWINGSSSIKLQWFVNKARENCRDNQELTIQRHRQYFFKQKQKSKQLKIPPNKIVETGTISIP